MTNTTPTSGAAEIATRLRNACASVRNKSYPLADLIPLMQQAADALASAAAPAEQRTLEHWRDHRVLLDQLPAPHPIAPDVSADLGHNANGSKCPITGREYFMRIDHPELGLVPTFGGPYDSYTVPTLEGEPTDKWHEREMRCERYDHDLGDWIEGGEPVPLRIIHEEVLFALEEKAENTAAPQPNTAYAALPMESAPKDGTMLRLQVMFGDGALEDDNSKPIWTIGFNNLGNAGEDEWQFAGWNWSHDCFSEGTGTPVGWLPMLDASSASHGQAPAGAADGWIDDAGRIKWLEWRIRDLEGQRDAALSKAATAQSAPVAQQPSPTPQADSQPVMLNQEAARAMLKEMDMNDRVLAAIDADPKKCTAQVRCINGRITTESCTTKAPLISNGESSDGERDYYICPDCRKDITIDYREN